MAAKPADPLPIHRALMGLIDSPLGHRRNGLDLSRWTERFDWVRVAVMSRFLVAFGRLSIRCCLMATPEYERSDSRLELTIVEPLEGEHRGVARHVSLSGVFIETAARIALGSEVFVVGRLPGAAHPSKLAARVRWANADGVGLQFGLLGAHDTHALVELGRTRG